MVHIVQKRDWWVEGVFFAVGHALPSVVPLRAVVWEPTLPVRSIGSGTNKNPAFRRDFCMMQRGRAPLYRVDRYRLRSRLFAGGFGGDADVHFIADVR
ncbi:MAG: hypothetical protein ACREOX_08965, partial [Stenotrophomonas sp.]